MASEWKNFGVALSLTDNQLKSITIKYSSNEDRLHAVIMCWEEKPNIPYTWETLDNVLRSIKILGAAKLADEVKEKIKTASTKL